MLPVRFLVQHPQEQCYSQLRHGRMEKQIEYYPLRVIISGGGTGGHIFPAIAIADALKKAAPETEILFVGAQGRMEMERVPQAGYKIKGLPVKGFDRKHIWKNFSVLKTLIKSRYMAREIIRQFAPDIVVGVGGYASAPTLKEAQQMRLPTLLQEQNSYAGVTNKLLGKNAQCICVAYPNMERFFPAEKIVMTGNPIRPILENSSIDQAEALLYFGFETQNEPNTATTLLIIGGSLGAKTINESVIRALPQWQKENIRLIWQTGKSYIDTAQKQLQELGFKDAYVAPFIDRMELAYAAADLVVSRAGASSISELCLLAKPSILIPSPNVAEDHQTKNAQALSSRGAAVLIPDSSAPGMLADEVSELIHNSERLRAMGQAAYQLAGHNATQTIVDEIYKLLKK